MLESDQAQYEEIENILRMMSEMLINDNNFFGIIGENNEALQFYVDEINSIRAEIPVPSKKGSYRKKDLSLNNCLELVQRLNGDFTNEDYPDFKFESWATLDA